jgi:hypothetical protein
MPPGNNVMVCFILCIGLVILTSCDNRPACLKKKVNPTSFYEDIDQMEEVLSSYEFRNFEKTVTNFTQGSHSSEQLFFGFIPRGKDYGELFDAIEIYQDELDDFRENGGCNGRIAIDFITTISSSGNVAFKGIELSGGGCQKEIYIW